MSAVAITLLLAALAFHSEAWSVAPFLAGLAIAGYELGRHAAERDAERVWRDG